MSSYSICDGPDCKTPTETPSFHGGKIGEWKAGRRVAVSSSNESGDMCFWTPTPSNIPKVD